MAKAQTHSLWRAVLLAWCLWLLGSWGVAWLVGGPVGQVMLFAVAMGWLAVWPACRLSIEETGSVVREFASMLIVSQTVLWPLRLTAGWSMGQTAYLTGLLTAWGLLAAALVHWGVGGSSGRRTVAAGLTVAMWLGGPVVRAITGSGAWTMHISPVAALWTGSAGGRAWHGPDWAQLLPVAVASAVAWAFLAARPAVR